MGQRIPDRDRIPGSGAGRDDRAAGHPLSAGLHGQRSVSRGHARQQPFRRRGGRAVRQVRLGPVEADRRVPRHTPADHQDEVPFVTRSSPSSLERELGPLDASAIVISNVIGVGIFTTPGFVAEKLASSAAILAVWALGGALAFAGALAYAELAAWRPQAGGEYVYFRESFGGLPAFLTGWTSFVAGFSGAIAAGGVGVAAYLDRFLPGAG